MANDNSDIATSTQQNEERLDRYEASVNIAKNAGRAVATMAVFGSVTAILLLSPAAMTAVIDAPVFVVILLGALGGITHSIWHGDTTVKVIREYMTAGDAGEDDEDEDDEGDEEAEEEEAEEEAEECEKCGDPLEVYDPKPICAECEAEIKYYARKNGIAESKS